MVRAEAGWAARLPEERPGEIAEGPCIAKHAPAASTRRGGAGMSESVVLGVRSLGVTAGAPRTALATAVAAMAAGGGIGFGSTAGTPKVPTLAATTCDWDAAVAAAAAAAVAPLVIGVASSARPSASALSYTAVPDAKPMPAAVSISRDRRGGTAAKPPAGTCSPRRGVSTAAAAAAAAAALAA